MKHTITKSFLLFLLLALAGTAKAQDYLPVVKDNAEWNIVWKATSQWGWLRITESLQLEGDTLVDDMHYTKVMRKISSEAPYWHGNTEEYDLYGLMREQTDGKVFYQPIDQDTTYLLYDFGMNVNDTMVMSWCQIPLWDVTVRIDSITTQYIAGMDRRVFYVSSKSTNVPNEEWRWLNTWIEGIGATEGLLYSCHVTAAGGITLHELLCYHENGELLYSNPDYNDCLIDTNDFLSIVANNTEWNVLWKSAEQPPFVCVTESLRLEGDTVVDDLNYKKVMRKLSSETQSWHGSTEVFELYGLIREEASGKVFYRPIDQDSEYLLYDFGMNVNDTEVMHFCQSPDPANEVVVRIDSIANQHIAEMDRRVFYVSSKSNSPDAEWQWTNTWIEGVGASEGLLYSCYPTEQEGATHHELLCYFKNFVPMFKNQQYEDCVVDNNYYISTVKDNAEWNNLWFTLSQPPFECITESLQLEGDTLVDDMHYKKVMRKISSETLYWNGSTEEYSLYGLIREEPEGKVFYQPIDQDTVYLLYDFGMNVNDTALMRYEQSPYPLDNVTVRIDSITTQYIAGAERRVYYVSSRSNNGFPAEWMWTNTWIEGIGATEGLLYSCDCTNCGGGPQHKLLCYHEEGDLLYMNPIYDACMVDNTTVEFAPVGAEWYYERLYNEGGEPTGVTYDRFRSLRTVEINGWECKEIEFFQNLDCNGEVNPHTEYRYITQEGKQVFEVENGERYLLYDFGKKPGEWWYAPKYEDTIYVQQLSYTFFADGSCRYVFITAPANHDNLYFNNIINGIGMEYSVFPFEIPEGQISCVNGPIRCYTENGIPVITSNLDCDYEVLAVNDDAESALVTVRTMGDGLLHVEFSETLKGAKQIHIIDVTGKTIHAIDTHEDICDIWLADKPEGIYIAQIITDSRIVHVKFVL